jgi:putative solute:sodium symporter small subunit
MTESFLVAAGLAVGVPLAAEPLNLLRIEGFPFGYYLAAQGGLVALVILAFVWAARQNRIDAEEPGHD